MAAGYTRQSAGLIVNGATIQDSHFNNEYNALEAFANATTGHNHDGTPGGGAPINITTATGTLPVSAGGTGATTAATARTALGLVIGTNVQAYAAELAALASVTSAADRVPYFTGSGTATVTVLTSFARSILDDNDAAAVRTTLGIGTMGTQNSSAVSISGGSITGITDLAVADGGTGSSTAAGARTNLSAATVTQNFMVAGFIELPSEKDYKIIVKSKLGLTITDVTTISESGTCTLTVEIDGTPLGGTANSVSASEQSQAHGSANAVSAGQDVVIAISSNVACRGISYNISGTLTLA